MKTRIKIKYLTQIFAFALIFFVFATPALASQISVNSVLNLINQDREAQGLKSLEENNQLMKVAQDKLNDMIDNHYFAHTSPAGISPWYWYEKNGYDYQYAGENLAINFLTAENQNKAWMTSPDHRKNILNSHYLQTGIAVGAGVVNGQTSIIAVEEFGTLAGAANVTTNGQNFSGKKNTDLIQKENKIVPQVLSVKNSVLNNLNIYNNPEKISNGLRQNNLALVNFISDLFALILLSALVLSPIAFLSVAFEKIAILWQSDKEDREKLETISSVM